MWSRERGSMGTSSHPQHCSHLILPTDMVQHRLEDFGDGWCTLPLPLSLSSLSHLAPLPHLPQLPLASLQLQASYSHPSHIFTDCKTGSIHLVSSVSADGGSTDRGLDDKNKSRGEKRPIPDEHKDEKYYERRKRNNQAAKKSRDARKFREDQIALRAMLLEQENRLLRAQLAALREEARLLLLH